MSDPSNVVPDVDVAYRPDPPEVARLLRARTKDSHGQEVGDWTADTRPTPEEVADLIDQAVGDVLAQLGPLYVVEPVPPDSLPMLSTLVTPAARTLVTLRAAMFVELSYFPEQVNSNRSAYEEYKRLYDDGLAALVGNGEDGGGVLPGAGGGHDSWLTPSAYVLGAQGWGYVWPEPENPANWRASPFQPPREPPLPEDLPVGGEPASPVTAAERYASQGDVVTWPPSEPAP